MEILGYFNGPFEILISIIYISIKPKFSIEVGDNLITEYKFPTISFAFIMFYIVRFAYPSKIHTHLSSSFTFYFPHELLQTVS